MVPITLDSEGLASMDVTEEWNNEVTIGYVRGDSEVKPEIDGDRRPHPSQVNTNHVQSSEGPELRHGPPGAGGV
jgi:hypothetical protein